MNATINWRAKLAPEKLMGLILYTHTPEGKTNLDLNEARDSEWQWHQLGHMQVCTSLQTDNHASTPPLSSFFTDRMPFLPPNQQCQSTDFVHSPLIFMAMSPWQKAMAKNHGAVIPMIFLHPYR